MSTINGSIISVLIPTDIYTFDYNDCVEQFHLFLFSMRFAFFLSSISVPNLLIPIFVFVFFFTSIK